VQVDPLLVPVGPRLVRDDPLFVEEDFLCEAEVFLVKMISLPVAFPVPQASEPVFDVDALPRPGEGSELH